MAAAILAIVKKRGKMHNPATDSGGVLLGKVKSIGARFPKAKEMKVGDAIVPLVTLSSLPLALTKVTGFEGPPLHLLSKSFQIIFIDDFFLYLGDLIRVEGVAVLQGQHRFAIVPPEFPLTLALHALDVSSLIPQLKRVLDDLRRDCTSQTPNMLIMGCGNAGQVAVLTFNIGVR